MQWLCLASMVLLYLNDLDVVPRRTTQLFGLLDYSVFARRGASWNGDLSRGVRGGGQERIMTTKDER